MQKITVKKSELFDNEIKIIHTKFNDIGILKYENKYYAFEDICTHDGEPISSGTRKGLCIECPRHQAEFDLETGKALCMPATENLPVFKIEELEDEIIILLEEL
jgi:3-phenylpropionate/trans-cinnamate dioxygenase ferredoxin subunit